MKKDGQSESVLESRWMKLRACGGDVEEVKRREERKKEEDENEIDKKKRRKEKNIVKPDVRCDSRWRLKFSGSYYKGSSVVIKD